MLSFLNSADRISRQMVCQNHFRPQLGGVDQIVEGQQVTGWTFGVDTFSLSCKILTLVIGMWIEK